MEITKMEIVMLLNKVKASRDNSGYYKDVPGHRYAALHAAEYENMAVLATKLENILKSNTKQISIK